MRKILNFTCGTCAAPTPAAYLTRAFALGVGVAVTLCLGTEANAQTLARRSMAQQLAPTAMGLQENPVSQPVSTAVARGYDDGQTVNAGYSVMSDESEVQPASYRQRLASGAYNPQQANVCNPGCDVSWYFGYEALWFQREGDEFFSLSRNTFLSDSEYEFGGRYTAGRLIDCVNAWEGVYVGPYDWNRGSVLTGAGNLQSNLVALNGYTAADINTFNNADFHQQDWRSHLESFELNRRWWVWDVLSTMIGVRYVDYEEDFRFVSSGAGGVGLLTESVDNQMAGAQIGADFLYPMSLRSSLGIRGKAGAYANFDERRTFVSNAGTTLINAGDSDVNLAGLLELGIFGQYQVVPSIRLTAGYEFWWMPGMATVPEQTPSLISPASGTTVFNEDDLFLHGGTVGVQVLF